MGMGWWGPAIDLYVEYFEQCVKDGGGALMCVCAHAFVVIHTELQELSFP